MKPSFEDIQFFLAVVEAKSFTMAADNLLRTKSAVSQGVTRLEKDLGVTLLYRSTRSLSLTEAGEEFYRHCCEVRDSYDNALESIKSFGAKPSGLLTVTVPHTLVETIVLPAVNQTISENSDIDIRLLADDKSVDLIDGQVDLAIRVGKLELQTAKVTKLGMLSESLYASHEYVQSKGGVPANLNEIQQWQHIAHDWQGQPVRYVTKGRLDIKVKPRVRCNTITDIIHLVAQGQGVARLPDITVQDYVRRGDLVKLEHLAVTPVHAMHMFANKTPMKVQLFIKTLKEHFAIRTR